MRRKIILYNAKLKRPMRALKKMPALTSQPPAFIALRTGRPRGGALRTLDIKINKSCVIQEIREWIRQNGPTPNPSEEGNLNFRFITNT